MILKAALFLILGVFSALLLILEHPTWKVGLLLALTVWCFCRLYYFAFYVIERYIDPQFHFSGLVSFLHFFLKRKAP